MEKTEGGLWGGAAEAEKDAERAELLAGLPADKREKAEKLLKACEGDFQIWSYTVTMMTLTQVAGPRLDETGYDLLKETLAFYRLAVIADNVKFWAELARDGETPLEELPRGLVWAYRDAMEKLKKLSTRLQLLSAAWEAPDADK